jgi:class 3 adenylate cyclase
VWPNVVVSDESVARCVSDVRFALGDRGQRIIKTVPRRGYLFAAEVNGVSPAATEADISAAVLPASEPIMAALVEVAPGYDPAAGRHGTAGAPHRRQQLPERRQLTAMACKFIGLATLSRRLNPEELQAATSACRQRCAEIIGRHNGYVARYLEDGFLAYFGYPQASEYDAEHAVRAGLALLRSAEMLSAPWPLQPRIGVASGGVVIADETAADGVRTATAVGEAPHLANHLQTTAELGTLVIDQGTRRLVTGLFEYHDLGRITRNGYPDAVSAWSVTGASRADNRFEARRIADDRRAQIRLPPDGGSTDAPSALAAESGLSPFVGRVKELEILQGCLAEASPRIRVIDILGEPGIGKSRLLHEFHRRLTGSLARVWIGNCWPGDEQMPFRPFIEVMRRTFRLGPADPEAEIARKLAAGLALVGLATAENLGLLLNLLGLRPPADSLRRLNDVLVGLRTRDLLLQLV